MEAADLNQEWYQQENQINSEEEMLHRSPAEEYAFYEAVSSGDINAVRRNCELRRFADPDGMGVLSRNPVTNMKYHFVVATALITRYCITAGMEMEQAFRLSDFYILKLDRLTTVDEVLDLHDKMSLDYTGKMRLLQRQNMSKPITECIEYIYVHIKEQKTLAAHTGLSGSYLSRLFKEEMGISISDFIREKKVEKAQHLLRYCDFSLIEIANYLSFSSQSHFIQTFHNLVGMTPKKYRDLYFSSNWQLRLPQTQQTKQDPPSPL